MSNNRNTIKTDTYGSKKSSSSTSTSTSGGGYASRMGSWYEEALEDKYGKNAPECNGHDDNDK